MMYVLHHILISTSLLVDVYIFLELFKSSRPIERKVLWALLVFFFPGESKGHDALSDSDHIDG